MGLSIASLVLGISAFFSGPIAGIPAVVTGGVSIARKHPGRGMAIAGIITGTLGSIFVGILVAVVLTAGSRTCEATRQELVWRNMGFTQTAMENWYIKHLATYPGPDVSWDPDAGEEGVSSHFPADDDGHVGLPVNPYTGHRYVHGSDLFYLPDQLVPGQHLMASTLEPGCPFRDFAAPGGKPGTIVVLGSTRSDGDVSRVKEHVVVGYGKNTREPMHTTEWRSGTGVRTYRVRPN